MGRPPLPLGTSGAILFATLPNGRVKARVKFRDWDGEVRLVSKTAASRAAAERALKTELTVRRAYQHAKDDPRLQSAAGMAQARADAAVSSVKTRLGSETGTTR